MYNVFRLTGDGLHCLALMVLFGKMNQTRSCAGTTNTSSLLASSAACWLWFGGLLALPRAERLAVRRDLAHEAPLQEYCRAAAAEADSTTAPGTEMRGANKSTVDSDPQAQAALHSLRPSSSSSPGHVPSS